MLKNISIAKRFEVKAVTHPTHDIIASDEKYENKVTVGSLWTRVAQDKNGADYKFLSGTLSKTRTGTDGKEYQGYVLITEKEWNEYQELKNAVNKAIPVSSFDPSTGEVAVEDIPFNRGRKT